MTQLASSSPLPLYHRIYMVLHQQIMEGAFSPDTPMPGELELAERFGVSRITMRRALEMLVREGMIDRQRGRGTFPTERAPARPLQAGLSGLLENLLAMGLTTRVRLLDFDYVQASDEVAGRLQLAPGAIVQRAVRVRSHEGQPMSHLVTWLPEAVGRGFSAADMEAEPLLSLLERSGIRVRAAEQTITACLADAVVAPCLDVEIGAPLLSISRVLRDQQDRPVEYIRALYRPDRYAFHLSMSLGGPDRLWHPELG
jgi:GntR family transcriptional regulator